MTKIEYLIGKKKDVVCLIDEEDLEKLDSISSIWCPWAATGITYARSIIGGKSTLMHRFILNVTDSKILVDHKNLNGLDNTKNNLRLATRAQNAANTDKWHKKRTYVGVSYVASCNKWRAYTSVKDKQIHLGLYNTAEEAAFARDKFVSANKGEFARLNYPLINHLKESND